METYPYKDMIKTPRQLYVSGDGNLQALRNDIRALNSYVNVFTSGKSDAQAISPLGNKFFLDTGVKCLTKIGTQEQRYAFVNNIPDDNIFGQGLVGGIIQNVSSINPGALFNAFSQNAQFCQKITMDTRDNQNNEAQESQYVNEAEIADYNACWFSNRKNPVSKTSCEGFTNRQIPKDPIVQVYIMGIGVLAAYMAFNFIKK